MLAVRDHDYCSKENSKEMKVQEELQTLDEAPKCLDKALESVNFIATEISESSLSPAHSTDSGIENTLDPILGYLSSPFGDKSLDFEPLADGENLFDLDFLLENELKTPLKNNESTKTPSSLPQETLKPNRSIDTQPKKEQEKVKVLPFGSCARGVLDETVLLEKNRKNAIAARENREKKKKYLQNLEEEADKLRSQNTILRSKAKEQQSTIDKLTEEVNYLKGVIANQGTISLLLKNIVNTPGISFSSSLVSSAEPEEVAEKEQETRRYSTRKRSSAQPLCEAKRPRTTVSRQEPNQAGICLHVQQNKVSLELCARCSKKSRRC